MAQWVRRALAVLLEFWFPAPTSVTPAELSAWLRFSNNTIYHVKWILKCMRVSKSTQAIVVVLGFLSGLHGKTMLLKILHALAAVHRETKLIGNLLSAR